tara:strand:- start:350 stop:595 length:246 start_codon:yes stop_codon:yes gene_type:complete
MATVTNWIDHLSASEVQGAVYPGVGTETYLVLALVVIWLGWHVIADMQEVSKSKKIAKKRPGSNDWKSNYRRVIKIKIMGA